ncbi:MAG: LSM domain-containing protein [Candidatus Thorarchaeota archaeon]
MNLIEIKRLKKKTVGFWVMDQPIKVLSKMSGNLVTIRFKQGNSINGRLKNVDSQMNMIIEEANEVINEEKQKRFGKVYIRGNTVLFIKINN